MSQPSQPNVDGIMVASDWLSGLFATPATAEHITQLTTATAQASLQWIGEQLGAGQAMQILNTVLTQDHPAALALHLQRRYTALFEGIFKHRAVLPYESAWQGSDSVIPEMQAILRTLDLHVDERCCEPPDHLAIELAALTLALRDEHYYTAADLVVRLQSWVPSFSTALQQHDQDGFYAAAAEILLALLHTARHALAAHIPTGYEGEFA